MRVQSARWTRVPDDRRDGALATPSERVRRCFARACGSDWKTKPSYFSAACSRRSAAQPPASDDPAPRCALLRATTTCLGIWLAQGATTATWGRAHPRDEALRIIMRRPTPPRWRDPYETSEPGTVRALDDGAVVAESLRRVVHRVRRVRRRRSRERVRRVGDDGIGGARVRRRGLRGATRAARSLATLYAPDSFASRYGLADVKIGVCLWLSFAVDPVAGALDRSPSRCVREAKRRL